jgi:hypothetical protein
MIKKVPEYNMASVRKLVNVGTNGTILKKSMLLYTITYAQV